MEGNYNSKLNEEQKVEAEKKDAGEDYSEMLIQQYCKRAYLWKIQTSYPGGFSKETSEQLSNCCRKFVDDTLLLQRGQTEKLEKLTNAFLESLATRVKNIKCIESASFEKFYSPLLEEFNQFHYYVNDLQNEKSLSVIAFSKKRFIFTREDPEGLERAESRFIERMFLTKHTTLLFLEEFVGAFRKFIVGFDNQTEGVLREHIEKVLKEFVQRSDKASKEFREWLTERANRILREMRPMQIHILMHQIDESAGFQKLIRWEKVHQLQIHTEGVELGQIISLENNHILIALRLKNSDKILFVNYLDHRSFELVTLLDDCTTTFCQRSSSDRIIFFQNRLRTAFISYLFENTIKINREIKIFMLNVQQISHACFIRRKSEIFYIDQSGSFGTFPINSSASPTVQLDPSQSYSALWLSDCGMLITLLGPQETYVYTNNLELVLMIYTNPPFACVRNKKLELFSVASEGIRVEPINIDSLPGPDVDEEPKSARFSAEFKRVGDVIKGIFS